MMTKKLDSQSNKVKTIFFTLAFLMALPFFSFSQKVGYQIKLKVDGFGQKELYLGYFYGDKQYLKDTSYVEQDGYFYFEGNEKLEPGGLYDRLAT